MTLPAELKAALHEAARNSEQPETVSSRILALLEAIYSGNESLDDREAMRRHIELILESISIGSNEGEVQ